MKKQDYINARVDTLIDDLSYTLSLSKDQLEEKLFREICTINAYKFINTDFKGVYEDFDPDFIHDDAKLIVDEFYANIKGT